MKIPTNLGVPITELFIPFKGIEDRLFLDHVIGASDSLEVPFVVGHWQGASLRVYCDQIATFPVGISN